MKTFSKLLMAAIFFMFLGYASVAYAHEHNPQDIQTLRDAAAAMKLTDPNLSDQLNKYADREATGKEEAGESRGQNIDLLNHAAKVLHHWPDLSGRLKKIAEKEFQEQKK